MAIVRLDKSILSIKGKCGGVVWKTGSQGQQVITKPRIIHSNRTQKQKQQNDWYCLLKREEYAGGPPRPRDPEPYSPSTTLVYQLESAHMTRQRTLTAPAIVTIPEPPLQANDIDDWIISNWGLFEGIPGITYAFVYGLFKKLFYRSMYTWGVWQPEAFADTCAEMIAWAAKVRLLSTIIVEFGGWLGCAAMLLVAVCYDFFSKHSVTSGFYAGESIIRLSGHLYWCRLVARPSKKMFDFLIGGEIPMLPLVQQWEWVREGGVAYTYDWSGTPQVIIPKLAWHDVYGWNSITLTTRYPAYGIGNGLFRMAMSELDIWYYNVPIGWEFVGDPFAFTLRIYD